jgi:hypothetical protein
MGLIPITNYFLPADITGMLDDIDKIRQKFSPYHVNFTPKEKKKFFKLGDIRESFAEKVMNIGTQHDVTVPPDVDIDDLKKLYQFHKDVQQIKSNKSDVDDIIDNVLMDAGVLLLSALNRIYNTASELAEKGNYPFNDLVKEAGKIYEKSSRNYGTEFTIPPDAEMKISKIVSKSNFINNGTTVLAFTYADEVSGKFKKGDAQNVNPGNSVKIPTGYSTIVVFNMSADQTGLFTVKIKK